jgi:hypothetical protein
MGVNSPTLIINRGLLYFLAAAALSSTLTIGCGGSSSTTASVSATGSPTVASSPTQTQHANATINANATYEAKLVQDVTSFITRRFGNAIPTAIPTPPSGCRLDLQSLTIDCSQFGFGRIHIDKPPTAGSDFLCRLLFGPDKGLVGASCVTASPAAAFIYEIQ